MLDEWSLYCVILCNFLKLLRNAISEPWFICISVYVLYKMGLATYFLSLSNINDA